MQCAPHISVELLSDRSLVKQPGTNGNGTAFHDLASQSLMLNV